MKKRKNERGPRCRKTAGGIKRVVRTAIDLLSFILGGGAFSASFFLMILCVGGIGVGVGLGSSSAENPLLNYLLLSVFTMILTGTSLVMSSVASLVTEYTEKKETMKTSSFFVTLGSVGIFRRFFANPLLFPVRDRFPRLDLGRVADTAGGGRSFSRRTIRFGTREI